MRPLSIGLRWAARYTAAIMLAIGAMAFVYYQVVVRHVRRDAYLLVELQANEIAEVFEHQSIEGGLSPELVAYVDGHVNSARKDLKLGIRIVDAQGAPLLERGSFERQDIPLPEDFERLARKRAPVAVDVGESFPYAVFIAPLGSGYAEVAVSMRRFLRGIRDLRNNFLTTLPFALFFTLALGWWLARGSLAPITRMTETARRITSSQLDERIPTSGSGDELDALAETLNAMMDRIRHGVERLRGFSSNTAHQLRTPVSRLRSRLEIAALAERSADDDQELISATLRDVERLGEAIGAMLRLSESEAGLRPEQRKPVALGELLAEVVAFFEPVSAEKGIALEVAVSGQPQVLGDASWLNELFSNLVHNALQYTPAGGHVQVEAAPGEDGVQITVRDDGPGIPADRLSRIFRRFERGPQQHASGSGLGLTVAREIVLAHGGRIHASSSPGDGSIFTVWLPTPD